MVLYNIDLKTTNASKCVIILHLNCNQLNNLFNAYNFHAQNFSFPQPNSVSSAYHIFISFFLDSSHCILDLTKIIS